MKQVYFFLLFGNWEHISGINKCGVIYRKGHKRDVSQLCTQELQKPVFFPLILRGNWKQITCYKVIRCFPFCIFLFVKWNLECKICLFPFKSRNKWPQGAITKRLPMNASGNWWIDYIFQFISHVASSLLEFLSFISWKLCDFSLEQCLICQDHFGWPALLRSG